jgi:2-polyprenyl-3-methyl-5-hydroxy-6-metoxy-1,4-benzoquinol methylase
MYDYQRHRLRDMARLAVEGDLLDIGCAQLPNPYLRGRRVVGLDLDDMPVRPPYTGHVVGDASDIDRLLPGEFFDTVLMGAFIEHVERPYDLLRTVRGHIRPEGRLVLATPSPLGVPMVVAELLGLRRFFFEPQHAYAFTPRWVWRLLERSGYRLLKTRPGGASLLGLWFPAPVALSYVVIYAAEPA